MTIKCIALDLDGTTLNARGELSEKNKIALERAIARGIQIVIASGRGLESLPQELLDMKGLRYAITSNGAAIYDLQEGIWLKRYKMTPESVEAVLRLTAGSGVAYEALIDGKAFAQPEYVNDPVRFGAAVTAIPYIRSTRKPVADFMTFLAEHQSELDSLDLAVPNQELKYRLWKLLEQKVPDLYITSSVQQLLELSHKDGGKHSGARFLLKYLGLKQEELAAFGDGDNDAQMLCMAGVGFAVKNASEKCREAADVIVPANTEDGVAWGIEQILS